jgi:PAS domain S-box-containing protein
VDRQKSGSGVKNLWFAGKLRANQERIRTASFGNSTSVNRLRDGGISGILDRLPLLISYTDAQHRLQYANRALLLALGRPVDTPVGVPVCELMGEGIYSRAQAHVERVLRGERTTFLDSAIVEGQLRHLELTFVPDTDARGHVQGYIGVGYDLTDRVQRETSVASREQQLSSILHTMAEGLVIHDREGHLIEANPAAERLLSLTRAQLLGWDPAHPHWKTLGEDGLPLDARDLPVMRALRTGLPERRQVVGIQIADAPVRWISVNAQPLYNGKDPGPSGVVGTFVDVTAVRQSMERIRGLVQRVEDVREQERHELALLLHEGLAQDLFSARLALGNLLRDLPVERHAALQELSTIIDRCLADTRQVAGSLRPTGPADRPIGEVILEHARYFEGLSKLRIQVDAQPQLPVSGEATRLLLFRATQEALTNIARHARAETAEIVLEATLQHVELRVADDGVGMPPGSLDKSGSLGLLGIRERARTMGGTLCIDTNAAGGTTLVLRLPLARAAPG